MEKLINAGVWLLEAMFAVGLIGSVIVILLTTVEDAKVLFEREQNPPAQ